MAPQQKSAWFDEATHASLIEDKAHRAKSFIVAVADGKIDDAELTAQESRVVQLMEAVEPQLTGPLHDQVTDLLCELTVFNFMQSLHAVEQSRKKSCFRG
jgi:hypothetical protein